MHGYLGFENSPIKDAIQKCWSDVLKYESVKRIEGHVETVKKVTEEGSNIFLLSTSNPTKKENNSIEEIIQKKVFKTRYVIFATGVEHPEPKIKNFNKFLGNGIWHCPHCDGFASTNKKLVIIASNRDHSGAMDYAKVFLGWTRDVTLFLQELECDKVYDEKNQKNNRLTEKQKNELISLGINVIEDEIITEIIYDSKTNAINGVLTSSNRHHKVDIVFYHFGIEIQNEIAQKLGCELDTGYVKVNEKQQTTIANVYAVGDMDTDRHYAILASASGAIAALAIYEDLLRGAISMTRKNNLSE